MTPLLEALQAAAAVGFDAPKCARCGGSTVAMVRACQKVHDCGSEPDECDPPARTASCQKCHATGLDASDPERLIGRAYCWLASQPGDPSIHTYNRSVRFVTYGPKDDDMLELDRSHDGTPAGLATALLRLVARVGGAA